jgi:cytoskeleton protein RodZ
LIIEEQKELIPMGLGDVLRHARNKRGLDLQTISSAVKVKPEVLAAIEAAETEQIPAVYLKGYIRSYARYLDIPLSVIEQHITLAKGAEPEVQSVFQVRPPRNSGDRWIKASSYVLASAVVIALVWQFTTEAVRFSQGDPVLRSAQKSGSEQNSASENATGSVPASTMDISPSAAPPKSHLRASIASMSTRTELGTTAGPTVAEGAWAAVSNRELANSGQADVSNQPVALEVLTSADSWVEIVDGNGMKIEMDLLRAGSRRDYSGAGPFRLLLGRASSVEVFHNGKKVDLGPYTRGNVARLTLGAVEDDSQAVEVPVSEQAAEDATLPEQG